MRERPTLAQIAGVVLLAWLASLALGPLGAAVANPGASGIGHALAILGYLCAGTTLILGVLALVGAVWRFRTGLLTAPATRARSPEPESEPEEPAEPLSESGGSDGFAEWGQDEVRPSVDWGFGDSGHFGHAGSGGSESDGASGEDGYQDDKSLSPDASVRDARSAQDEEDDGLTNQVGDWSGDDRL